MASNDAMPMPAESDWKDRANSSRSHRPQDRESLRCALRCIERDRAPIRTRYSNLEPEPEWTAAAAPEFMRQYQLQMRGPLRGGASPVNHKTAVFTPGNGLFVSSFALIRSRRHAGGISFRLRNLCRRSEAAITDYLLLETLSVCETGTGGSDLRTCRCIRAIFLLRNDWLSVLIGALLW